MATGLWEEHGGEGEERRVGRPGPSGIAATVAAMPHSFPGSGPEGLRPWHASAPHACYRPSLQGFILSVLFKILSIRRSSCNMYQ